MKHKLIALLLAITTVISIGCVTVFAFPTVPRATDNNSVVYRNVEYDKNGSIERATVSYRNYNFPFAIAASYTQMDGATKQWSYGGQTKNDDAMNTSRGYADMIMMFTGSDKAFAVVTR